MLATVFALSATLQGGVVLGPIVGGFVGKGPLGATLGQSVRLTVFNPGNERLPLRLTLFDLGGNVLARRDVNLPSRKGAFLEVDLEDLGLPFGERVEIMGVVRNRADTARRFFVSLQVIDTVTGVTILYGGWNYEME